MAEEKHYVYILECGDGSYYTGWTTHLDERVETHASGHGAKYTRSHLPVQRGRLRTLLRRQHDQR